MRKIKKFKEGYILDGGGWINCPMAYHETKMGFDSCIESCAWFHIEESNSINLPSKAAYCKDHCIGEVIE